MDAPKATAVAVPPDRAAASSSPAPARSARLSGGRGRRQGRDRVHLPPARRRWVCVADGFGVKVTVNRGALVVEDGIGKYRRTRRYDRATHGLRRLVLVQPEGFVTFEALRWCEALGTGVVVLGRDGVPVLASTPRLTDDARLRRVQALAPNEPVGLGVARYLLSAKVAGQASLVARRFAKQDPRAQLPGTEETFGERSATIAELAEAVKVRSCSTARGKCGALRPVQGAGQS